MVCQKKRAEPIDFTEDLDYVMSLCPKPADDESVCEEALPDSKLEVELEIKKGSQAAENDACDNEACEPAKPTDVARECADECR